MKRAALFVFATMMIVMVSGCTQSPVTQDYTVLSQSGYNRSLCAGTGFNYVDGGFSSGMMIVPIDPEGNNLSASVYTITQASESTSSFSNSFMCQEQLSSRRAVIGVFSSGYAPKAFVFEMPEDQLVTLGVPLKRSCTGEKGCFDTSRIILEEQAHGNQSLADENMAYLQDWFHGTLSEKFLLNQPRLDCTECNSGRGGYLKANGTQDGTPFSLYYHTGWCSPGGGDCGWSLCFSEVSDQPSAAYQALKAKVCSEIEFYNLTEYTTPETYSYNRTNDLTNETRLLCRNGGFEFLSGNSRTISVVQDSSRLGTFATRGEADCLAL